MKKKKETLWQLLQRLDEEAGQYNFHMHEANRYFDNTALATKKMLEKHEKKMHKLIAKVQKALKSFTKQKKKEKKKA
jgi:pyrroline-5-carboxylate reductase